MANKEIKLEICRKCNIEQNLSEFIKCKSYKDGYRFDCKTCYKLINKERLLKASLKYRKSEAGLASVRKNNIKFKQNNPDYAKQWSFDNKEHNSIKNKQWYLDNKEKKNAQSKEWEKNNKDKRKAIRVGLNEKYPERYSAYTAKYRAAKLQATPSWVDLEEIKEIYKKCKEVQWLSEELLEVDHIIPLQGKNVCGLHVHWNLQILTRSANRSKGNR